MTSNTTTSATPGWRSIHVGVGEASVSRTVIWGVGSSLRSACPSRINTARAQTARRPALADYEFADGEPCLLVGHGAVLVDPDFDGVPGSRVVARADLRCARRIGLG